MPTLEAIEHLVGLQSQAPLARYVALWSRLESFDPVAAGAALERGELVRTHAMRATVHLFSRRDAVGNTSRASPKTPSPTPPPSWSRWCKSRHAACGARAARRGDTATLTVNATPSLSATEAEEVRQEGHCLLAFPSPDVAGEISVGS